MKTMFGFFSAPAVNDFSDPADANAATPSDIARLLPNSLRVISDIIISLKKEFK
jgi:hypothetical protein